ncbi:MAG: cell division protein FtsA [Candidatus Cloacimonadota bacterium]|nr:MAG: cell division protein FtsA [Candidatus Cloacimonadota bacterium]PIE77524.1 MAG: cell division protein FtsA [Candidatus Delongbacteria bacterium]
MKVISIDIGTVNIKFVLLDICDEYGIMVEDFCIEPSAGVKYGSIIDVNSCSEMVAKGISNIIENNGDCNIDHYLVALNGKKINTVNGSAAIDFWSENGGENVKISEDIIEDIIEKIKDDNSSKGEILHIFPQEYVVDDHPPTKNPIDISGRKLKASAKLVIDESTHCENLNSVMLKCGIKNYIKVFAPVALSEAVVHGDERSGSIVLELGGGSCNLVIWYDGILREAFSIPLGSVHITQDIKIVLQTDILSAEKLKIDHGTVLYEPFDGDPDINIPSSGIKIDGKGIKLSYISGIIQSRFEEIFELMIEKIYKTGFQSKIDSPIILTGDAFLIKNSDKMIQEMLNAETKWGKLRGITKKGKDIPESFFIAIGAAKFAYSNNIIQEVESGETNNFFSKAKNWLKDLL